MGRFAKMRAHDPQPPIDDYALLGDTRSAALCSSDGSIDWLCWPRFDSDPVFGRLVGGPSAGSFAVTPVGAAQTERRYRDGSCVLETTWRTPTGVLTLTDGMALDVRSSLLPDALLVRRARCTEGRVEIGVRFDPRRWHAPPQRCGRRAGALVCSWRGLALSLETTPDLFLAPGEDRRLTLDAGQQVTLALGMSDRAPAVLVDPDAAWGALERTDRLWRSLTEDMRYDGPQRPHVIRSLLTLRALTYSPSGAPIAAATTSLPEAVGGSRNWDYRFSWPRDASMGVAAFLAVGLRREAVSFMHWLLNASRMSRPELDVLYTVHGKPPPDEHTVEAMPGYRDSTPVRVGNGAAEQHQLDVYGFVLDAAWLMAESDHPPAAAARRALRDFAGLLADRWQEPDSGIWERRGPPRQHVHSKMMAWLGLDRASRIPGLADPRWRRASEAIRRDLHARGFDEKRNTYVAAYDDDRLDAALLLLPVVGMDPSHSPRVHGTIDAVWRELSAGGPLVYRYPPGSDGMDSTEGAFLACSFWLAQALARVGRRDEAHEVFAATCALGNDVGLFAEEMDPSTRRHLGNMPQALTHAALVQAALALCDQGQPDGGQPGVSSAPSNAP